MNEMLVSWSNICVLLLLAFCVVKFWNTFQKYFYNKNWNYMQIRYFLKVQTKTDIANFAECSTENKNKFKLIILKVSTLPEKFYLCKNLEWVDHWIVELTKIQEGSWKKAN